MASCGICLAITFNGVARALALRLSVSMVMVYSLHLLRALPRQFKIQNGVNEPSLEYLSDESLSMQSLFEQGALLVFKAFRGMAPMYLQDLLQVKTPGRYSLSSDALGLHKVLHTCMVQDLWRPRNCFCSSQILEQPSSCYQRESDSIDNFKRNLKTPTG